MDYTLEKELKVREAVTKMANDLNPTRAPHTILSFEPYIIEGDGWGSATFADEGIYYFGDITIGHMDSGDLLIFELIGKGVFEIQVQNKTPLGIFTDVCFNGINNTGTARPVFCGYKITFL